MGKKFVIILMLSAFIAVNSFAQEEFKVSYGGGGYFTNDFGGGVEAKVAGIKVYDYKTPYFAGGAFVFYDTIYFELSLGFLVTSGEWEEYAFGVGTVKHNVTSTGFDFGALGKYPFAVSEKISIFPLFGIIYRFIQSVKFDGETVAGAGDLSTLWLKFGGGFDCSFTNDIFLRIGALYGIRLENQFERDMSNLIDNLLGGMASINNLLGHGLDIKLAIGYRLQ